MPKKANFFLSAFLLLLFISGTAQVSVPANEEEQKKLAQKLFEEEDYGQAFKVYSTLLAHYPKDPLFNYRIGVCILNVGDEKGDRKSAIHYLEIAKSKAKELEKELLFYLGRAYHINYDFDDALLYYNEYRSSASESSIKKLKVNHEIQMARNGKTKLGNFPNMIVLEKKRLPISDYFRSYQSSIFGGNLIVKPEEFKLPADKKKKDRIILFQSKDKGTILFASYGDKGENGKDIYIAKREANGEFSKPIAISKAINTEYDEDYPFLSQNNKTLYFCSKGHNSIGGYDIFKSVWDENLKDWSKPENMAFPINTPLDDIQYVTDSLEKIAIFSSNRISETGKIDVYKLDIERRPVSMGMVAGEFLKTDGTTGISTIYVKDIKTGESYGPFKSDENGKYLFEIPNGKNFIFTIETPGLTTQSQSVNIPITYDHSPVKQVATYEDGKLIIKSFIGDKDNENNYKSIKKILLEKMKMDITSPEEINNMHNNVVDTVKSDTTINNTSNKNTNEIKNDKNIENEKFNKKKNIDNNQLIEMSSNDLKEISIEVDELNKQIKNSEKTLFNLKEAIDNKETKIDSLNKLISNKSTNDSSLINELEREKNQLNELSDLYKKATDISSMMKSDYQNKEKERKIQEKLVNVMMEIKKNPKNKDKEKLLVDTETELIKHQESYKEKQHDEIIDITKNELDQAQKNLEEYVLQKNKIEKEINNTDNELKEKKNEIVNEKDESLKENLQAEIDNLEIEKKETDKTLKDINQKILKQEKEIEKLKNQNDFVNGIIEKSKSDNFNSNELISNSISNSSVESKNKKTSNNNIKEKYEDFLVKINDLKSKLIFDQTNLTDSSSLSKDERILEEIKKIISEKLIEIENQKSEENYIKIKTDTKNELNIIEEKIKRINDKKVAIAANKNKNQNINNQSRSNPDSILLNNSNQIFNETSFESKEKEVTSQIISARKTNNDTSLAKANITKLREYDNILSEYTKSMEDSLKKANTAEKVKSFNEIISANKEKQKKNAIEIEENFKIIQNIEKNIAINDENLKEQNINDSVPVKSAPEKISTKTKQNYIEYYSITDYKNEKANELKEKTSIKLNELYAENIILNKQLKDIEINNDSIQLKNKEDSLKQISTSLRQEADKIRREIKSAPSEQRKSMIKEAEQKEELAENNLLLIKTNQLELKKEKILNNTKFLKEITLLLPENESQTVAEVIKLKNEIEELTTSMNTYNSESKTKRNYDSKNELITMSVESGDAAIEKQNTLINIILNKLPAEYSNLKNIQASEEGLTEKISENKKEKIKALEELYNANFNEFKTLKEEVKNASKKSKNKNNKEIPGWISEAELIFNKSKALNTQNRDNNILNLDSILKRQEDALMLMNKAIIAYKNEDVKKFEDDYVLKKSRKAENEFFINSESKDDKLIIESKNENLINEKELKFEEQNDSKIVNSNNNPDSIDTSKIKLEITEKNIITDKTPNLKNDSSINEMISSRIKKDSINEDNKKTSNNVKTNEELAINKELNSDTNVLVINKIDNRKSVDLVKNDLKNKENNSSKDSLDKENRLTQDKNKIRTTDEEKLQINDVQIDSSNINIKNSTNKNITNNFDSALIKSDDNNKAEIVKSNGIKVDNTDAYTDSKPIPIDKKFPDGLVFTVQVGAFKNPVPNSTFKGLTPVNGTQTSTGFIRYQAGMFDVYKEANAAKNDLVKLGFKDAFVAVYKNNQRIPLNEALKELNLSIESNSNSTTGITNGNNLPDINKIFTENNKSNTSVINNFTSIDKITGVFYTVQIGIFSDNVRSQTYYNLTPIQLEPYNGNKYRYMAGVYNKLERIRTDALKVRQIGITDAFICAYQNGKRVTVSEIKNKENDPNFIFAEENPIIFNNSEVNSNGSPKADSAKINQTNKPNSNTNNDIIFSNGVNKEPDATPENGIKLSTEGITFKIQIGAYSKAVPGSVTENWIKIKNWPIRNYINQNQLIIYTVGSFGDFQNAKKLLEQIKSIGVQDAFITIFKDGKRLYGNEAAQYTR